MPWVASKPTVEILAIKTALKESITGKTDNGHFLSFMQSIKFNRKNHHILNQIYDMLVELKPRLKRQLPGGLLWRCGETAAGGPG